MAKRTWKRPIYQQALTDLGVEYEANASNVDLDKILVSTLTERNPDKKKEIDGIKNNLFDQTVKKLGDASTPATTDKDDEASLDPSDKEGKEYCPSYGEEHDASSADCKACAKEAEKFFTKCVELSSVKKATTTTRRAASKSDGSNVRAKYDSFEEQRKHIKAAPDKNITMMMDKELLKGGSLTALVKRMAEWNAKLGSNDFLKEGRIKSHMKHREGRGWIYTWSDDGKTVKHTGYADPALTKAEQKEAA